MENVNIPTISIPEARDLIETLAVAKWDQGAVPSVCLVGESGIGKTRIPIDVARKHGAKIVVFRAAEQEGEDIKGIPYPDSKDLRVFKYRIHESLAKIFSDNDRGILFFDDWNRGDKDVVNVLFSMVENREICSVKIPDQWYVMGAINPHDSGGYMVRDYFSDPAFRRRFSWIRVRTSKEAVISYGVESDWDPVVIGFLETLSEADVLGLQELKTGEVGPRPSSWESISNLLKSVNTEAVIRITSSGMIGERLGERFSFFYSTFGDSVNEDLISAQVFVDRFVTRYLEQLKKGGWDKIRGIVMADRQIINPYLLSAIETAVGPTRKSKIKKIGDLISIVAAADAEGAIEISAKAAAKIFVETMNGRWGAISPSIIQFREIPEEIVGVMNIAESLTRVITRENIFSMQILMEKVAFFIDASRARCHPFVGEILLGAANLLARKAEEET